jgi:hypothetical protein
MDVFDFWIVRSPSLPGSQVYREANETGETSTKRGGSEKIEIQMKKNGEVGQLIGGGWVNLLSAVTRISQDKNYKPYYLPLSFMEQGSGYRTNAKSSPPESIVGANLQE